jgi:hypothetical protein
LTLSPESHPAPEQNCNLTCAADPTTICGGNGFITLYKARSTTNDTTTSKPLPTPTPMPSTFPTPPHKSTLNMTPIWIGISLSLLALFLFVLFVLNLESRLHASRQRATFISSIPPPSFTGSKLQENKMRNRMSRNPFQDGRRFGVVGLGVDGEVGVERVWDRRVVIQSVEEGMRNRDTFEAWKRGVVPPLRGEEEKKGGSAEVENQGRGDVLYEGERQNTRSAIKDKDLGTSALSESRDYSEDEISQAVDDEAKETAPGTE